MGQGYTSTTPRDTPGVGRALQRLQEAWEWYWANVSQCWQRIVETIDGGGDIQIVRDAHRKASAHSVVIKDLGALRKALQGIRFACERAPPEVGLGSAPPVFDAILMLLRHQCDTPTWRRVRDLIANVSPITQAQTIVV